MRLSITKAEKWKIEISFSNTSTRLHYTIEAEDEARSLFAELLASNLRVNDRVYADNQIWQVRNILDSGILCQLSNSDRLQRFRWDELFDKSLQVLAA